MIDRPKPVAAPRPANRGAEGTEHVIRGDRPGVRVQVVEIDDVLVQRRGRVRDRRRPPGEDHHAPVCGGVQEEAQAGVPDQARGPAQQRRGHLRPSGRRHLTCAARRAS